VTPFRGQKVVIICITDMRMTSNLQPSRQISASYALSFST